MRLIDADKLLKDLVDLEESLWTEKADLSEHQRLARMIVFGRVNALVRQSQTADTESVTRCKDCKHRPKDNGIDDAGFSYDFPDYRCPCRCEDGFYSWMPDDDWYCANAERREE